MGPGQRVADCTSAALYVTGIPAGGTEDLLRGLFGSYGTIRKVHLYRDRATGEFKGDGLLVFQLGPTQDKEHFVNLVCMQVSVHQWCASVVYIDVTNGIYASACIHACVLKQKVCTTILPGLTNADV
jgi:hypothetical protein